MSNDISNSDLFFGAGIVLGASSLATYADSYFRDGETIFENLTQAKVQRTALYTIASIAAAATSFLITTAINACHSCDLRYDCAVLSGFTSIISMGCLFGATSIRDYEDRKELSYMKAKAQNMSFRELKKEHGLASLQKYEIVNDLPARFQRAYATEDFNTMVRAVPLAEITRYDLCDTEFLRHKFELSYAARPFSEIVSDFSLNTIAQYALSPLSPYGFLHHKFVSELKNCRATFLKSRNLENILYQKILTPSMYQALVDIKNQLLDADLILKKTLSDLDIFYSDRTDIQEQNFLARERNIPYLARKFGDAVAARAADQALNNAVVNAVYEGNTSNMQRDANNGFHIAETAGKCAEEAELARLYDELYCDRTNPFNIARGMMQQQEYNYGIALAYQTHENCLRTLDDSLDLIGEIYASR